MFSFLCFHTADQLDNLIYREELFLQQKLFACSMIARDQANVAMEDFDNRLLLPIHFACKK